MEQLRQSSTGAWPHSRRNVAANLLHVLKCHTRVHRLPSRSESIQVNYRSKNVCVTCCLYNSRKLGWPRSSISRLDLRAAGENNSSCRDTVAMNDAIYPSHLPFLSPPAKNDQAHERPRCRAEAGEVNKPGKKKHWNNEATEKQCQSQEKAGTMQHYFSFSLSLLQYYCCSYLLLQHNNREMPNQNSRTRQEK